MGRKPAAAAPSPFSAAFRAYTNRLIRDAGGDLSGRWLAAQPVMSKTESYYLTRQRGETLYNTNDLGELAELFEMTPQALVREAIAYAHTQDTQNLIAFPTPEPADSVQEDLHAAKREVIDPEEEGDRTP